jgi:hypothetical protein
MTNGVDGDRMADVYVERSPRAPSMPPGGHPADMAATDCFRLHRVHWQETRLSADGARLICRFRAPDAESVRIALTQSGIPYDAVWIGDRSG